MSRAGLPKSLTTSRLRWWLLLFFLLLATPVAALIWHAWNQLKWEAFHQHRGLAEELASRINASLTEQLAVAESRSFADYEFLVLAGDSDASFVQRSPLSVLPVVDDMPGVLGYFQIGTAGKFTTPLLPDSSTAPDSVGISSGELSDRLALSNQMQRILGDNRLVDYRPRPQEALAESAAVATESLDSQQAFDRLKNFGDVFRSDDRSSTASSGARSAGLPEEEVLSQADEPELDLSYEQQSVELEKKQTQEGPLQKTSPPVRLSRKEKGYRDSSSDKVQASDAEVSSTGGVADESSVVPNRRITTFESEIDPLEISLLNSGHFVAYRTVWREGQRMIQGMLIEQQRFVEAVVKQPFRATGLYTMSELSVLYQNELLATYRRNDNALYSRGTPAMEGTLLYRNRLVDPLNAMELVFSIKRLPPGPGAKVLAWVTLALATVFCGGFYLLYRTGREQIALAAQQQDFVSAVSHELKTPLTSIRLYGEMLREGWADDDKKQQYYEYIHDESERLGRLIDNVLQLARINRNERALDLQRISAGQLMQSMENRLEQHPGHMDHELVFIVEAPSRDVVIKVDEDSFAQVMINLIDNALKFSEKSDNKQIEINCRLSDHNHIQFSVRDYGPGIPKGQLKKIFRMFYRSESELTRETVGTGIGLAIVHQLCQLLQAEVDVVNRTPGAEFRVVFAIAE